MKCFQVVGFPNYYYSPSEKAVYSINKHSFLSRHFYHDSKKGFCFGLYKNNKTKGFSPNVLNKMIDEERFIFVENSKPGSLSKFKPIPGFPKYCVSSDGKVYSYKQKKLLKPSLSTRGYFQYHLINAKGIAKWQLAHRLVAEAFVPNDDPENKKCINHKDLNRKNNDYANLEWCTYEYNNTYRSRAVVAAEKRSRPIVGEYVKTGEQIHFASVNEAVRCGFYQCYEVAKEKRQSCRGFKFFYQ